MRTRAQLPRSSERAADTLGPSVSWAGRTPGQRTQRPPLGSALAEWRGPGPASGHRPAHPRRELEHLRLGHWKRLPISPRPLFVVQSRLLNTSSHTSAPPVVPGLHENNNSSSRSESSDMRHRSSPVRATRRKLLLVWSPVVRNGPCERAVASNEQRGTECQSLRGSRSAGTAALQEPSPRCADVGDRLRTVGRNDLLGVGQGR